MISELAITAAGISPFYVGLIALLTRRYESSFWKLLLLFLLSGLTTLPFFGLQWFGYDKAILATLFGPLFSIVLLAFSEELVKSFALLFGRELRKHIYYPIIIGLGFAFFENISYLFGVSFTTSFLVIGFIRLFVGSTAHAVFTTLVAHVMNKGTKHARTLYYLLGILLAGSFHSFFNLLHHWDMSYMTIPLLVVLIVYLHFDHKSFDSVHHRASLSHNPKPLHAH